MLLLILPRKLRTRINAHRPLEWFLSLLILYLAICLIAVISIMLIDKYSFIDALWLVWQTTTTVGYGDIPPKSTFARIITMVLLTGAIITLSAFIGASIELYNYNKERRRFGLKKNKQKNGIIIISFPGEKKIEYYIQQIRHDEPNIPICIVDSQIEELPNSLTISFSDLHFIKGDLLRFETFEKAALESAARIMIFAPKNKSSETDAITSNIVRLVEQYLERKNAKPHIAHYQISAENSPLFEGLRSSAIFGGVTVLMAVQESRDPGTATFFETLLRNDKGANPYSIKTKHFIGTNWSDFMQKCLIGNKDVNCQPLGIINGKEVFDLLSANYIIKADDTIIVSAKRGFCWDDFESSVS
jgi:hypothetical protein